MSALNDHGKPVRGSKVCVLGLAYKKDVDDSRESPSFELMELLMEAGAELSYHDPHIPTVPKKRDYDMPAMQSSELTAEFLQSLDCVLIATDHSSVDYDFLVQNAPLVVDTRNATADVTKNRDRIYKA